MTLKKKEHFFDEKEVADTFKSSSDLPISSQNFEMIDDFEVEGLKLHFPKQVKSGETITSVKLVTDAGEVHELGIEEAKALLNRHSENVKKIVIEQVRQRGADRMSLHLNEKQADEETRPKNSKVNKWSDIHLLDHKQPQKAEIPQDELQALERDLNSKLLKNNSNISEESNLVSLPLDDGKNHTDDFIYRQRVLIRKRTKRGSDYFYRATNHLELYNIGKSYLEDYKKGIKNFAFCTDEAKDAKEKTVLGLTSFFNYHEDITVTILTSNVADSYYSQIVHDLKPQKKIIEGEEVAFMVYESSEFNLIEFDELKLMGDKFRTYHLEDLIQEVVNRSDLIFWDLPTVEQLSKDKKVYFPISRYMENVSLIIKSGDSRYEKLHKMIDHFKKYGVRVKGVLFDHLVKTKDTVENE